MAVALQQEAWQVLMVRPAAFGYNAQTAISNRFQNPLTTSQAAVWAVFDAAVEALQNAGVAVFVMPDAASPAKPDAVFPNNWFALDAAGTLTLFPMAAPNRRLERTPEIQDFLSQKFHITKRIDLTPYEAEGKFLEGTGSIVFDHLHKTAYACYSERTHPTLLANYCKSIGYQFFGFDAVDAQGVPIYHTNVLMALGASWAVVCLEALPQLSERAALQKRLQETGRTVVPITRAQMQRFCGNILGLRASDGRSLLVLSQQALEAFASKQLAQLSQHAELLPIDVGLIETIGGGGIRCMLAEIFAPQREGGIF
jgi:hypothetical protein